MKPLQYIFLILFSLMAFLSCNEGIDPISKVDPGPDESSPEVQIIYPSEGTQIRVLEEIATINIEFEVSDDIEIATIIILIDGEEIQTLSEFKDYRRVVDEIAFDNVTNGEHTLTVEATDLEGKSTSSVVNFEKVSPYTPVYSGEILYMPFDGDYTDLVNLQQATVVGNPGFAGESIIEGEGVNAYSGAEGAYLTLPAENFQSESLSAVFWMKINAVPDRAGILVMGPPDEANPEAANNRVSGFRFFRENAGGNQRFKLNVGNGDADTWFDGGEAADVDPATGEWVHMAFTISGERCAVYIDGLLVKEGDFAGADWSGCDILSIMSGAPRFTGWNHLSDQSYMDELRLFDRELSRDEIQMIIADESGKVVSGYEPEYDGEVFFMPFEDEYIDRVSGTSATVVGTPGFIENGIEGFAYSGAEGSYLTRPTDGLLSDEFSASFWMNVNADPDRAGILVIGPEDVENPETQNNRSAGIRIFREAAGEMQRFKLNVGTPDGDVWVDGGEAADVDPSTGNWVHFATSISETHAAFFINGEEVKRNEFSGLNWEGCDLLSIMSGAPRFTGWNHLSDQSSIDELRIFNKALSREEILSMIGDDQ